jgi:hypothetical protein
MSTVKAVELSSFFDPDIGCDKKLVETHEPAAS